MFFKNKAKRISVAAFVFSALFFFVGTASAGISDNAIGWLWGGSQDGSNNTYTGVGWISLNSTNCDLDNNGFKDLSCGGDNSTTLITNYGVNFPTDGSAASGYAWSENLGWISFNTSDLSGCPSGECLAKMDGESLKGWARVVAIKDASALGNSGGWSGFINLDRLDYNSVTGKLNDYAWNGENINDPPLGTNIANGLGWISSSRAGIATISPPPVFSICKDDCGSGKDLSTDPIVGMFSIPETKNLRACLYSWGCIIGSFDVTEDLKTTWSEEFPGSGAISLSGSNPKVATSMQDGNESITASYEGISASVHFSVSSFDPITCWRCDSVSHKCSSSIVYALDCPEESPIGSESECGTICKVGSWKEVAP